jgi:hypothetical protein
LFHNKIVRISVTDPLMADSMEDRDLIDEVIAMEDERGN